MRAPIKFKSELLSQPLRKILPNANDPTPLFISTLNDDEFSRCVSAICIDGIWKTTKAKRHLQSNELIRKYIKNHNEMVVLDVGVSDGVTSISLVDIIGEKMKRLYVTDLYLSIYVVNKDDRWYIYKSIGGPCVMAIFPYTIFYKSQHGGLNILKLVVNNFLDRAPMLAGESASHSVSLLNPRLVELTQRDNKIKCLEWNIFTPWSGSKVDLVRVANVLNPSYFTKGSLQIALGNIVAALKMGGALLVVDNRLQENATLFRNLPDGLVVIDRTGQGCDVEYLIGDLFSASTGPRHVESK